MKKRLLNRLIIPTCMGIVISGILVGCGTKEEMVEPVEPETIETETSEEEPVEELHLAESEPYHEDNDLESDNTDSNENNDSDMDVQEEAEEISEYLPGYDTEQDYKTRHTGSASLIEGKTVLVSIFVDEEEDVWTNEEKAKMLSVCNIAYPYIMDTLKNEYDADVELIYDWTADPDLYYNFRVYESIPAYVTSEQERHIDELELEWVEQVPYKTLMEKYETDSIAFLYFIPHEGCSYSSMHFMDDGDFIWNEGCLLYLQDMYSPTYEYETPTVFAHELLHLFGAEDYYSSADVYSKETYSALKKECATDIMLSTFDTINGVYTTYPDYVRGDITPVTAYLLGVGEEKAIENVPELVKEEAGCFAGSTYDRPF